MRQAALEASTYPNPTQRAVSFHEHRVNEIVAGDHDLDVGKPQLIAHIIPAGYPQPHTLSASEPLSEMPPHFLRHSGIGGNHKYGKITKPPEPDGRQSYNLLTHAGGVETVSGAEMNEFGEEELLYAGETEVKLAATVHWAQEAFVDKYESDELVVLASLTGVKGEQIRIPDAKMIGVDDPVFTSDRVNPWPVKVPLEAVPPADTYDQLVGLFDRLWSSAGLSGSIFYRDGAEASSRMRRFSKD